MHKAELLVKHACGLVQRKRGGTVVDENPPFLRIFKKMHGFGSWLMSVRARNRWLKFKAHSEQNGMKVIEIPLPNQTRVAGTMILYQGMIRNKCAMDMYAARAGFGGDAEFRRKYPSQDDWELLSQYEGILSPLQDLSMSLQTDDVSSNSASLLEIYLSKYSYENMRNRS
jgi:hypothetical protein